MCAPAVHTTLECTCTGTRATGTKKFIDRATQPGEITELSGRPETGEGRGCGTTYGNWFAKFPPLPFTPSVEGVVRRPFCDCFIYIWRKIRSNIMYYLEKNVSCYKYRWMLIVFVLTKLEIVSRSCFLKRRLEIGGSRGKRVRSVEPPEVQSAAQPGTSNGEGRRNPWGYADDDSRFDDAKIYP